MCQPSVAAQRLGQCMRTSLCVQVELGCRIRGTGMTTASSAWKGIPVSRRTLAIVISTALTVVAGATPAAAHSSPRWPSTLALPAGFQPEGIAIGDKPYAYFGSRVDGDIYRVSLRTGKGSVVSEGPGAGNPSLGLKIDDHRLFVAGGTAGTARVV